MWTKWRPNNCSRTPNHWPFWISHSHLILLLNATSYTKLSFCFFKKTNICILPKIWGKKCWKSKVLYKLHATEKHTSSFSENRSWLFSLKFISSCARKRIGLWQWYSNTLLDFLHVIHHPIFLMTFQRLDPVSILM